MTFNEYVITPNENIKEISEFYLNFLLELTSKGFPVEEQMKLPGASTKFINSIKGTMHIKDNEKEEFETLVDLLISALRKYSRTKDDSKILLVLFPNRRQYIFKANEMLGDIYSMSLDFASKVAVFNNYRSNELELNGFYQPKNTNKDEVKRLIIEAIELIKAEDTITEKAKKQIVEYLERVLRSLDYSYVSWTSVLGNIREVIIILGALGSFASGFAIFQAKEKLEETTTVIQKTSINLNFNSINENIVIKNQNILNQINTTFQLAEKVEENSNGEQ
jgi:hypothetical protein